MLELKATNVPTMYNLSEKKTTITHRKKRTPKYDFPSSTSEALAIKKRRASRIRKSRKGKTQIPDEIKRLAYIEPKLSPVGEEEDEGQAQEEAPLAGGMPSPDTGTRRRKQMRSKEVPQFALGLADFAEETEEEVKKAAKGAFRAPTLSDTLKNNPDYPNLKFPRTRRKGKRSVLGYAPDEDKLGPLSEGGRKQKRGRKSRKTRRR